MAARHNLAGEVDNRSDGVAVMIRCDPGTLDRFSNDIIRNAPPASQIKSFEISQVMMKEYDTFTIAASREVKDRITEVSPDIAVCNECLDDMMNDPARKDYPFINCTNCGPRFTIIRELPYDRSSTSMSDFRMCHKCRSDYYDILDRRFHAQPVACNLCGPVYTFKDRHGATKDPALILCKISDTLAAGGIIAIKGMGGYNLMCDAMKSSAVNELRKRKRRDAKPFAVMFRDISAVRKFCQLSREEETELKSWRRPVMILKQSHAFPGNVNSGLDTIGAMLPYMPFHYLMFRQVETSAVVLTSGNISNEPIITGDKLAEEKLSRVADAFVSYNREILNRVDDSVVRIIDKRPCIMRRSRGFVPRPVDLSRNGEGIAAFGAAEKNSFCIGKGSQAIMSQYIGDLTNADTFDFFIESFEKFSRLFRFTPGLLCCDLHPDYPSVHYAEKLGKQLGIPLLHVQHHHAHVTSCMAEHGLGEEVIGVCLDGAGYGDDGEIWGGEFLVADLHNFRRASHFDYVPLPGGDKAVTEPWRMALSYVYKYLGKDFLNRLHFDERIGEEKIAPVTEIIEKNINSPLSSGAGRLFDAVSAILGLCSFSAFDSEAPMRLESVICDETDDYYPYCTGEKIVFAGTIAGIIEDMEKLSASVISAKFHNTVAMAARDTTERIREETSIENVVLSGGVFQNKYLLEKTLSLLRRSRFRVFTNHSVPVNDGGISLGQLITASKKRESCA